MTGASRHSFWITMIAFLLLETLLPPTTPTPGQHGKHDDDDDDERSKGIVSMDTHTLHTSYFMLQDQMSILGNRVRVQSALPSPGYVRGRVSQQITAVFQRHRTRGGFAITWQQDRAHTDGGMQVPEPLTLRIFGCRNQYFSWWGTLLALITRNFNLYVTKGIFLLHFIVWYFFLFVGTMYDDSKASHDCLSLSYYAVEDTGSLVSCRRSPVAAIIRLMLPFVWSSFLPHEYMYILLSLARLLSSVLPK